MSNKNQRVYVVPKRKGVADYWHDFRTWIGNAANDIYDKYQEGTKDLEKYYVNMQGSTGGLADEGEIYIPNQDNASDHIQKVTAKDALDGTLIGLAESGLLSSTLAGAISAPITTGAGMMLPYAVDYANKYNMFGASDNQKEMAYDLAAFMPIGGIGKKFINPRTFKYNFYPKQYATTAMRRDVARNEINKINQLLNVRTYNTSLNIDEQAVLTDYKNRLNRFLENTNNIEKLYLPNRIKNYKNIFTNYNGTINPTVPFTPNINSINITNRINRVNNALANTQRGTKRFEILMQEKNRLNALRNNTKPDLFDNNTLVNYIVNNPKTAYAMAGMISTLPLLYPSDTTSVNTTRPPLDAEYSTSSNTTVPSIITSTDTARVSNRDTTSISRKDTVRTNRTDTTSNKNYVNANTKQDTATVNRNNNRNSSNSTNNNNRTNSSNNKTNTSSSKTNENTNTTDTQNNKNNKSDTNTPNTKTNTNKTDIGETKRKSKKQRRQDAEQQAKLAQLRQAMGEANSKVLDDIDKEMYYYGRSGPVYTGNRYII